jgi:hypothetical protein
MIDPAPLDGYCWLTSAEAAPLLELARQEHDPLRAAAALRRACSAEQARLVLEQAALRRRAVEKFPDAQRMFFTDKLLQQATDHAVAAYKAQRFAQQPSVADLCCGIGGDLIALASRSPLAPREVSKEIGSDDEIGRASGGSVLAVDVDPLACLLAEANCRAVYSDRSIDVAIECAAVDERHVAAFAAWHIDPDRRPAGRRTTRTALAEPNLQSIERLLAVNAHAAVKLAPAADVPREWTHQAELEWIGRGRSCRQLVAWHGRLAQQPGWRRATILASDGTLIASVLGQGPALAPLAPRIGRYVFEPDSTVLAADLAGPLAEQLGLESLAPTAGYLTGERPIDHPAVSSFEVLEALPLDIKRLRAVLQQRGMGRLEIKQRGADHDPEILRRQLQVTGEEAGTLIVARIERRVWAIVARRCGKRD